MRDALLNNLCDNSIFDPEPVLIKYWDTYGNGVTQINDLLNIIPALLEMGVPDSARFKAPSLWRWIAKNASIDPEICDWINECYPPNNTKPTPSERQLMNTQPGEHITSLVDQVAELTERLRQAEEEIASLKIKAPAFRHMTPLLELVAEVQERYWGDNWDRDDHDTKPRQDDIIEWVAADPRCPRNDKGKGSANQAKMVAVVAKPNT